MPDDKNLNTVQQYVGDMVALEDHIEEAIDGQLKEVKDYAPANEAVNRFHQMVKDHREGTQGAPEVHRGKRVPAPSRPPSLTSSARRRG